MAFETAPDLNKTFVLPPHIDELLAMYDGNTEVTTVLTTIKTDLIARINAGHVAGESMTAFAARTNLDGKCRGLGVYPKSRTTGNPDDDGVRVICDGCGGYCYTVDTNTSKEVWAITETPKTEA